MNYIHDEMKDTVVFRILDERATKANEVEEFTEEVMGWVNKRIPSIAVDFDALNIADSSFVGGLITAYKTMLGYGGEMVFFNACPAMLRYFKETVLTQVFTIVETEQQALGHLKRTSKKTRGLFSRLLGK